MLQLLKHCFNFTSNILKPKLQYGIIIPTDKHLLVTYISGKRGAQSMSGDTFAKMMDWISAFIAKMVDLFKQLGEIFSV